MQSKFTPLAIALLANSFVSAQQSDSQPTAAISSFLSAASVGYDRLESLTNAEVSSLVASGREALSSIEDILATANPSQISVWESAASVYATNPAAYNSLVSEVNSAYERASPTSAIASATIIGTATATGSAVSASATGSAATAAVPPLTTLTGTNLPTTAVPTDSEGLSSALSTASEIASSVVSEISSSAGEATATPSSFEGAACTKEVKYGALAGAAMLGVALML